MAIVFYPNEYKLEATTIDQKLEILLDAAEQYKTTILDAISKTEDGAQSKKRNSPRDVTFSYNWEEIAKVLKEIRDLPENNPIVKKSKSAYLNRLADVYEILRSAKMPKLEAVRLALINEASHLGDSSRVS
jgi:hypothetical protein